MTYSFDFSHHHDLLLMDKNGMRDNWGYNFLGKLELALVANCLQLGMSKDDLLHNILTSDITKSINRFCPDDAVNEVVRESMLRPILEDEYLQRLFPKLPLPSDEYSTQLEYADLNVFSDGLHRSQVIFSCREENIDCTHTGSALGNSGTIIFSLQEMFDLDITYPQFMFANEHRVKGCLPTVAYSLRQVRSVLGQHF